MELRPYQQRAVDAVEAGWSHAERQLGVAATGSGKTVIFSHLASRQPGRTLILAHREELIAQAVAKLHAATGIHATVERADQRVVAIEVKLGAEVTDRDVRHLTWLREQIGDDLLDAVVVNTGQQAYRRRDGIAVVPAALLGP